MALINFGYITNAARTANSAFHNRNISPPTSGIDIMDHNMGDVVRSQIIQLMIMGGKFDFLWGVHTWGDSKYKVTK